MSKKNAICQFYLMPVTKEKRFSNQYKKNSSREYCIEWYSMLKDTLYILGLNLVVGSN